MDGSSPRWTSHRAHGMAPWSHRQCHATGFLGATGSSAEVRACWTASTSSPALGKAMGGALGGFTASAEVIELPPALASGCSQFAAAVVAAGIRAFESRLRRRAAPAAARNTAYFREHVRRGLTCAGHPICRSCSTTPRSRGNFAQPAGRVYAIGFFFPVVPRAGQDPHPDVRSARANTDRAIDAFVRSGGLGVLGGDTRRAGRGTLPRPSRLTAAARPRRRRLRRAPAAARWDRRGDSAVAVGLQPRVEIVGVMRRPFWVMLNRYGVLSNSVYSRSRPGWRCGGGRVGGAFTSGARYVVPTASRRVGAHATLQKLRLLPRSRPPA